jgi:hypothetical protein
MKFLPMVAALLAGSAAAMPAALPAFSPNRGEITSDLSLAVRDPIEQDTKRQATGNLLSDIGKEVEGILTVVGLDTSLLLIELSPEVVALLAGIGLGPVGVAAGAVIAAASTVGVLLAGLGPVVDGLLIVVATDVGFLLISLSVALAALLSGLGLPALGIPLGVVVATIGADL